MIAKFTFSSEVPGKQLNIDHITGKVNKFFMREIFLESTSDITMTQMYMNVGGTDYDLQKVTNLVIYTNRGSVLTISKCPQPTSWLLNGAACSESELIEKLNEVYVNENKKEL